MRWRAWAATGAPAPTASTAPPPPLCCAASTARRRGSRRAGAGRTGGGAAGLGRHRGSVWKGGSPRGRWARRSQALSCRPGGGACTACSLPHQLPLPPPLPPKQKLLDAKLKRVAQEGASARAAGRNPLADARDDDRDDATGAPAWPAGRQQRVGGRGTRAGRRLLVPSETCWVAAWGERHQPECRPSSSAPCAADLEAEQALADAAMAALLEEEET